MHFSSCIGMGLL